MSSGAARFCAVPWNDGLGRAPKDRQEKSKMNEGQCAVEVPSERLMKGTGLNNPTVVENIDAKIASMKAEIARLEASKITLAPLLSMKIRDIREAMNY